MSDNLEYRSELRSHIIDVIDRYFIHSDPSAFASEIAEILKHLSNRNDPLTMFGLDSIVYSGPLKHILNAIQWGELSSISEIRLKLLGLRSEWNTFVVKFDFTKILDGEFKVMYLIVSELLASLDKKAHGGVSSAEAERQQYQTEELANLFSSSPGARNVHEMLVLSLCDSVLSLPYNYPLHFNPVDESSRFSVLLLGEGNVINLKTYVSSLLAKLNKLKGGDILYISVHISANGPNIMFG